MLTLTQLAQLRDSTITYAERAAVWREACEIRTTQADAEQVVFFLQGQHDNNRVLVTAAREINKYLDQTASVIEYKNRAIASLEDSIDELRGKIKGKDEGLARLQGEIVTLQAEITGLRHDITEHEERSDITEHEARSAVEIKGLKQQLTVAKEALSKEQATNADLRSMSDGLSTLVAKLRADHAQAALESLKGENQKLRVAFNLEQLKLTDIQGQRDTLAAQMDATTDLIHRMRSDHAQALSDRQQLRIAANALSRQLMASLDTREDEINGLKTERDALLRQLATYQETLEDTTPPDADKDPDEDPELTIISEVLPRLRDLPIAARERVMEYLMEHLVGNFMVAKVRG
jgi:chromosome segregation ATPase